MVLFSRHPCHVQVGMVSYPLRNGPCECTVGGKVLVPQPGMVDNTVIAQSISRVPFQESSDEGFGISLRVELRRKGHLKHEAPELGIIQNLLGCFP